MPKVDVYLVDMDGDRCPYAPSVEMEVDEEGFPLADEDLLFPMAGIPDGVSTSIVGIAYEFDGVLEKVTITAKFNFPKVPANGDNFLVETSVSPGLRAYIRNPAKNWW